MRTPVLLLYLYVLGTDFSEFGTEGAIGDATFIELLSTSPSPQVQKRPLTPARKKLFHEHSSHHSSTPCCTVLNQDEASQGAPHQPSPSMLPAVGRVTASPPRRYGRARSTFSKVCSKLNLKPWTLNRLHSRKDALKWLYRVNVLGHWLLSMWSGDVDREHILSTEKHILSVENTFYLGNDFWECGIRINPPPPLEGIYSVDLPPPCRNIRSFLGPAFYSIIDRMWLLRMWS